MWWIGLGFLLVVGGVVFACDRIGSIEPFDVCD